MEKNYLTELKEAIKDTNLDVDFDKLDLDKDLSAQGIDSVDYINMLFAIEDYFHISIPDDALLNGKLDTLNKIFSFIADVKSE